MFFIILNVLNRNVVLIIKGIPIKSTIKKFKDSLIRGTGQAYLLMKENPEMDFSDEIIKGALKNYAYDGQSEDSRAHYIYSLYSLSNQKEMIRNVIINGYSSIEEYDSWSYSQWFELIKFFIQKEGHDLKQLLFDSIIADEWYGYSEIIELYGLEGLLHIAKVVGAELEGNDDNYEDDYYVDELQEQNQTMDVLEELREAGQKDGDIQKYYRCILQSKEHNKQLSIMYNNENESWVSDPVRLLLDGKAIQFIKRKITITEQHYKEVADRFLAEKSVNKKEQLLSFFKFFPFPYDCEILLRLAQSRSKLSHTAQWALENVEDEKVRVFALKKLQNARVPGYYVAMFMRNYKEGDEELHAKLARQFHDKDSIENLMICFNSFYSKNKTPLCVEPLTLLYNKSNCAIHRKGALKIMIKQNVLPDRIREEMQYDCSEKIRELYRKHFG